MLILDTARPTTMAESIYRSMSAATGFPSDLIQAAYLGNVEQLKTALILGDNPNKPTGALTAAAAQGNIECLRILLRAGADPNLVGPRDQTPLRAACGGNPGSTHHLECLRELLNHGADPNIPIGSSRSTALHTAALLDDHFNNDAINGKLEFALLLTFGGDPSKDLSNGASVWSCAKFSGNAQVLEFLDATAGWTGFKVAVAFRLHKEARKALRLGRIDPSLCMRAEMLDIARNPEPTKLGATQVCRETIDLVLKATSPWSPSNHSLYHQVFRDNIEMVLRCINRMRLTAVMMSSRLSDADTNVNETESARTEIDRLLPREMWLKILSFLTRKAWAPLPTRVSKRRRGRPGMQ